MEYAEFGRTGFKVSRIGMGTYYDQLFVLLESLLHNPRWISPKQVILEEAVLLHKNKLHALKKDLSLVLCRGDKSEKVNALKKGVELGINLIDTAEIYESEPVVAEAIQGFRREDLFIATKVSGSHLRYQEVLKSANASLRRLKCSYIDLYMIHWPNPKVPIEETMKAMEKLVKDGKIRFIGVSDFSTDQMRRAEEALSKNTLASNQIEYNLMHREIEEDLLPYCEKNNIAVMPYQPIAVGVLANPNPNLKSIMNEISKEHGGKTPAQIALNWLITKSKVTFPIPRASRLERIVENVGSVGWALDAEELRKLEMLACLKA